MRVLGLDEAGRGCVLGPLVVGAFCVDTTQVSEADLRSAGATDSKKLSARRRASAWAALQPLGTWRQLEVSPAQIDAGNLNQLEEEAFIELIAHFAPEHVWIDAPTHPAGIPNLTRRLEAALTDRGCAIPGFTIEPKADLTYAVVGAASIGAKLLRDSRIAALGPVGSGYPSDPKTRAWLTEILRSGAPMPSCVRTRWGTLDKLRQQHLFGGQ